MPTLKQKLDMAKASEQVLIKEEKPKVKRVYKKRTPSSTAPKTKQVKKK